MSSVFPSPLRRGKSIPGFTTTRELSALAKNRATKAWTSLTESMSFEELEFAVAWAFEDFPLRRSTVPPLKRAASLLHIVETSTPTVHLADAVRAWKRMPSGEKEAIRLRLSAASADDESKSHHYIATVSFEKEGATNNEEAKSVLDSNMPAETKLAVLRKLIC